MGSTPARTMLTFCEVPLKSWTAHEVVHTLAHLTEDALLNEAQGVRSEMKPQANV